jgi:hypothetical protein
VKELASAQVALALFQLSFRIENSSGGNSERKNQVYSPTLAEPEI